VSEQRAKKRLTWAQSADIARATASICNNEQALFGVMSGHDRKILSLSGESGLLALGFIHLAVEKPVVPNGHAQHEGNSSDAEQPIVGRKQIHKQLHDPLLF
jgi:hypothetical protein